jgi:hypothetical protein
MLKTLVPRSRPRIFTVSFGTFLIAACSYILQEQLDIAKYLGVGGVKQQTTSVAPAVTGAVSWRREGLKYKKNEVPSP